MLYSMCVAHSPNKMCETAGSDVCQAARRLMKAFTVRKCLAVGCCGVQYDHLIYNYLEYTPLQILQKKNNPNPLAEHESTRLVIP